MQIPVYKGTVFGFCRHLHNFCLLGNLLFSNLAADTFDSMNFCLKHMQIPLDIFRKFRK